MTRARTSLRLLEPVDDGDVGVLEAGQDARLPLEPREAVGIARDVLRRTLSATSRPSRESVAR